MMDMLTMIVKRVKTLIILTLVESRLLGPSICSQTVSSVKNIWKSYIWTADKDVNESDPRSNVHYLGSSENKAWKKFRPVRDLNPWPLRYRCSALPTELASQLGAGHDVGSK